MHEKCLRDVAQCQPINYTTSFVLRLVHVCMCVSKYVCVRVRACVRAGICVFFCRLVAWISYFFFFILFQFYRRMDTINIIFYAPVFFSHQHIFLLPQQIFVQKVQFYRIVEVVRIQTYTHTHDIDVDIDIYINILISLNGQQ